MERSIPLELNALMVRYIVSDVDTAITFYTRHLGFRVLRSIKSVCAILARRTCNGCRAHRQGVAAQLPAPIQKSMKWAAAKSSLRFEPAWYAQTRHT